MADSLVRLRVDSQEYDQKLKRASEGLSRYIDGCRKAGGTLEYVDDGVMDFVRSLGKMETVSNSAKGSLSEMSKTFTDLTMKFNGMSEAEKKAEFGKALSEGLDQLKGRIIDSKEQLADIQKSLSGGSSSGGRFGGGKLDGMLQVFGGNLMTKAAGMAVGFASEIGDAVKQGIELAKAGEGIRIAFERLGRGDILQGLREATHGTVTDLELMKAAVKFNDFKLPLDQLGTMLAFAQQKAKDTGQSIDYLVDSIVTGLGRKSLMILDNLGLSATEVKEKMKETGDMTKAVGAIIREQMSKAGDYMETAADRAAQANVSLQNKMEELGRKFAPLEEASNQFWTSMKIGILDVIGGPLTNLLNKLTEAGRLMNAYGQIGGSGKVGRMTQNLSNAREDNRPNIYQQQQEKFWRYINPREQQIKDIRAWQRGERNEALQGRISAITEKYGSLDATKIQAEVDAAKKMLSEYQQAAKTFLNPIIADNPAPSPTSTTTTTTTKGGSGKTEPTYAADSIAAQQALVSDLTKKWNEAGEDVRTGYLYQLIESEEKLKTMKDEQQALKDMKTMKNTLPEGLAEQLFPRKSLNELLNVKFDSKKSGYKDDKNKGFEKFNKDFSKVNSGVGSIVSGIQSLGIELPQGLQNILGVLQGMSTIMSGISVLLSLIQVDTKTTAIATTADASIPFFARGGIVPHAAGGYEVPGTHYSGDVTPILANAGEVVLNRAQVGGLKTALEGAGTRNVNVSGVLRGTDIVIAVDRSLQATGRGELVTWGK